MMFRSSVSAILFLSTPSARRATSVFPSTASSASYFYPRPPRGGRRRRQYPVPCLPYFYPRPPRGGRRGAEAFPLRRPGISIHALREEGDEFSLPVCVDVEISIHALREEGDVSVKVKRALHQRFLSTPSARRATSSVVSSSTAGTISIHALREEGDSWRLI